MRHSQTNLKFDNRVFLVKEEWETYRRRLPVRFIKKKKPSNCEVCFELPTDENGLQNSHIIGFNLGLIDLGLTPQYLDNDENIKCAHRKICNASVELSLEQSMLELKRRGVGQIPDFLPEVIQNLWNSIGDE